MNQGSGSVEGSTQKKYRRLTEADFVFNEENLLAYMCRIKKRARGMRLNRELIEDVVQEAALKSILMRHFFNKPRLMILWILNEMNGDTKHECGRAKRDHVQVPLDDLSIRAKLAYTVDLDCRLLLDSLARKLSKQEQDLYRRYFIEGRNSEELAVEMRLTPQAVRLRLKKIKLILCSYLGGK